MLYMCLSKHHAVNTNGGIKAVLHALLFSVPDGGQFQAPADLTHDKHPGTQ
jgi:hypothetical protein